MFLHRPLPEYWNAYVDYYYGAENNIGPVEVHSSLAGSEQNGVFEDMRSKNLIDVVCGHQHWSNFTLKYEGVRLTMAVKTTEVFAFYEDENVYLNGASVFTLSKTSTDIKSVFVDKETFHLE